MIIYAYRGLAFAFLLFWLCASVNRLRAAEPEVIFEDNFSELDASFPPSDAAASSSVENNTLVVTAQPGAYRENLYQSMLFQDIDLSVRVQLTTAKSQTGSFLGIAFWALDSNHYHVLAISDNGNVAVVAMGRRTYQPLSWRVANALKTGADEWNELRVMTVGNRATVYLNGQKLGSFKGQPPESGSLVGPVVAAYDQPVTARFSNLRVVVPSGPDAKLPDEHSDPNVIYSDDFARFDPGWGEEAADLSAKGNVLSLKAEPGYVHKVFYEGVIVDDIDASVTVTVGDKDPASICSGGIIFWADDYQDYYIFDLSEKGQISISHKLKDRWLYPVNAQAPRKPAKFNPDAPNELRVVTSGRKAMAYLNGAPVGAVTAPAPFKRPWKFGLAASADKVPSTAEFRSLLVRKSQGLTK